MWIHVRFVSWILNLQSTKLAVLAAPAGDTFLKSPYNPFWKNCGWLELNQIKANSFQIVMVNICGSVDLHDCKLSFCVQWQESGRAAPTGTWPPGTSYL